MRANPASCDFYSFSGWRRARLWWATQPGLPYSCSIFLTKEGFFPRIIMTGCSSTVHLAVGSIGRLRSRRADTSNREAAPATVSFLALLDSGIRMLFELRRTNRRHGVHVH